MSLHTRRSSFSTSTALAKRQSKSSSENKNEGRNIKATARKRSPLGDITNQKNSTLKVPSSLVPCSNKIAKVKKGARDCSSRTANTKSDAISSCKVISAEKGVDNICDINVVVSSEGDSVSRDETLSTSDSFQSLDVEYVDNCDVRAVDSINKKTLTNLCISDNKGSSENVCSRDVLDCMEINDKVVNIDNNFDDPQLCATIACDIYNHLRESEARKRPAADYIERVQKDINSSMRAILIDWLVEVAEEYRLVPDTLYLTVNYIDRYLSGNAVNRQKLQLLGVSCMMIASKCEEITAPQVEEFCYITDNTYFKEEVLEMESAVLNHLKFEMTAPTAKSFLRRFIRVAHEINEDLSMQLESLACYISELSLLEYNMLRYAPSVIAASSVFLARFILQPSKRPWNSTLQHYTLYRPSDLTGCVKDLHRLFCSSHDSTLPAMREKYSQHKYKSVAKKFCPPAIPEEVFYDQYLSRQE